MTQMLTYIGEPKIDKAKDKFLCVQNPDMGGYCVQILDVYKNVLSETEFWQDSERNIYRYFQALDDNDNKL